MLKLIKAFSVLAVLLAAGTVVTVGYFMVVGTEKVHLREEQLKEQSAIEAFRTLQDKIPKRETPVSPLVLQAQKLALILNPPKPPAPPTPPKPVVRKPIPPEPLVEVVPPGPKKTLPPRTNFKLLATCVFADHPEKSLALIDLAAKGHDWVREGEDVGHLTINRINDGNIVIYQGSKEKGVLYVPEQKTSSLVKSAPVKIIEKAAPEKVVKNVEIEQSSGLMEKVAPEAKPVYKSPPVTARRETRKLPPKPTKEQQAAIRQDSVTNIKGLIKDIESSPVNKDQAEALKTFGEVLKFIEQAQKAQDAAGKSPVKKEESEKKK